MNQPCLPYRLRSTPRRKRIANFVRLIVTTLAGVLLMVGCLSAQTLKTIYDFGTDPHDGADPQGGLVFDESGNIFGMAAIGSFSGNGMIFMLSPSSKGQPWTETVIHRFHGTPDGESPECLPIMTKSGKLFGTTYSGGARNLGAVVEAIPPRAPNGTWTGKVLYSFGSFQGDGKNPNFGLTLVQGTLYGVTSNGGSHIRGTVFQLTPPTSAGSPWTETILHSFAESGDATFPSSDIAVDANGNLYGTTLLGGANNVGAVYKLSPPASPGGSWTEEVIYSFSGTDGSSPFGHLIFDASGAIYGTTSGGGANEGGTVYQLSPPTAPAASWIWSAVFNFTGGRDGGSPVAGVMMDKNGRLFGGASTGGSGGPDFGGVLFVLDPPASPGSTWTETVLHSFGGPDGFFPVSPLVMRQGKIYGGTQLGGRFGTGTIFVLTP